MQKLIILDSGHGFNTIGKESPDFDKDGIVDLKENEFNDSIVNKLGYSLYLNKIPYYVVSPSWSDTALGIRTRMANNFASNKDAIFVSIHADAFTSSLAKGTTIFKHTNAKHNLAEHFHKYLWDLTPTDRGIKTANFQVLRETKMPAILIEAAFMTNPDDLILLKSEDFRNKYVDKLTEACKDWYEG